VPLEVLQGVLAEAGDGHVGRQVVAAKVVGHRRHQGLTAMAQGEKRAVRLIVGP